MCPATFALNEAKSDALVLQLPLTVQVEGRLNAKLGLIML